MINYSFIIPHHNSPELLQRCIDSIPQRDDIEIIVADDNSEPGKKANVTRSDVQTIYIDNEHSKGAGRARNIALQKAKGKWLLFADCDDFYLPGFLDILDKYLETDNDVIYFNVDSVETFTLKPSFRAKGMNRMMEEYNGDKDTTDAIKYKVHSPWDKMINHDFVKKYDIYFEEVPKGNDIQFGFILGALAKKVAVEKEKVYVITVNPYGITFGKKSMEAYLRSFENGRKINAFFDYIGHPDWKESRNLDFLRIIKHNGVLFFAKFMLKYIQERNYIISQSDKYVRMVESRIAK